MFNAFQTVNKKGGEVEVFDPGKNIETQNIAFLQLALLADGFSKLSVREKLGIESNDCFVVGNGHVYSPDCEILWNLNFNGRANDVQDHLWKAQSEQKKTFAAGTKIEFWSAVYLSQIRPEKKKPGLKALLLGNGLPSDRAELAKITVVFKKKRL
ncbi:hypothetical protein [Allobaculum sp. Allo2]|uniref:hypothetical protein n=1 Tax=Allobaculum sp. Allo2 TaxID=2853432 RepID=UPI001F60614F|nr:hypothetical protein [Allobaculum sp. Allo2]UNT92945.1 hypothetical protein KWG61_12920 [Allobaculum sp. Allo2]